MSDFIECRITRDLGFVPAIFGGGLIGISDPSYKNGME
jgi:hypothetical protein